MWIECSDKFINQDPRVSIIINQSTHIPGVVVNGTTAHDLLSRNNPLKIVVGLEKAV